MKQQAETSFDVFALFSLNRHRFVFQLVPTVSPRRHIYVIMILLGDALINRHQATVFYAYRILMEGGAQREPSLLDELGLVEDEEHETDDPGLMEDIAFELEELGESDLESWEEDGEEIFVVPSECVEPLFRGFLRRALDVIGSLREPLVDPLLAFARLDQALGTLEKLSQSAEPMKLYREVAKKIPPILPVPLREFCIIVHTGEHQCI